MYELVWTEDAQQRLAAVWVASDNRNGVTRATDEIDNTLERFPANAGECLFDTVRELEEPPLSVEFEVMEEEKKVVVMNVWETTKGRPDLTGN